MKGSVIKYYIIPIFLCVLVSACMKSELDGTFIRSFKEEIRLESKDLDISMFFRIPYLEIMDSFLIVIDKQTPDKYVSLFHKDNLHLIKQFCDRGKGPFEIAQVSTHAVDEKNRIVYLIDWEKNILWQYKIDSVLIDSTYNPTPIMSFLPKYSPIYDLVINNKKEWYGIPHPGDSLILYFNQSGKEICNFGLNLISLKSNEYNKTQYSPDLPKIFTLINHDINKLAVVYIYFDIFSIYDLNNEYDVIHRIGPDKIDYEEQLLLKNKRYFGYFSPPRFDDKFIYILYHGHQPFSIVNNKPVLYYPDEIFMFDWSGTPLKKIILDHSICTFAFDRDKQRIIAYTYDQEMSFIEYDLKEFY